MAKAFRRGATAVFSFTALGLILATATACAGIGAQEPLSSHTSIRDRGARGSVVYPPGTRFATIEEAAIAALSHLAVSTPGSGVDRLRIGAIVSAEGSYTWQPADSSRARQTASGRPIARLTVPRNHVATFVAHPRTGDGAVDRRNEAFTDRERRIVDELDPLHRPLFLLTPSGRIVSYVRGTSATEIADLRAPRRTPLTPAADPRRQILAEETDSDGVPAADVVLAEGPVGR